MLCFRIDAFNESMNDILKFSIKLIGEYFKFCLKEVEFNEGKYDENKVVF